MHTSVFAFTEATASDLVTVRNTARLVQANEKAKLQVKTLPERIAYKPLVIVGPSGAGKGTLIEHLTSKFPDAFGFSVSYTTRKIRPGEEDGKHYNFVTTEKFNEMIANDEFIEHCQVHDKQYGTARS